MLGSFCYYSPFGWQYLAYLAHLAAFAAKGFLVLSQAAAYDPMHPSTPAATVEVVTEDNS